MSRKTEYQFVSTDAAELIAKMIATYESDTGETLQPASPEHVFIRWLASIILQERAELNHAGNQNLASRAEGEYLDELGKDIYNSTRPEAAAAASTERFTLSAMQPSAVLIPAGTRVTDRSSTLFWATTEDAYISIGDLYADVPIKCLTAGSIGNGWTPGQICVIVDRFSEYLSEVANTTASEGGAAEADDDDYYGLMVASLDAPSTAGAENSYIYYAKEVSTEIADVVANTPSDGLVKLYALMSDGTLAGAEIKSAILAACSARVKRPLTDHVQADDATTVPYNISLTYYIPADTASSAADIEAAVQEAVSDYVSWQCAKFGRDISPDRLRYYLMQAGVKRIDLTAPAFTVLKDGSDNTAPEIASVGTITVINGGYEDE